VKSVSSFWSLRSLRLCGEFNRGVFVNQKPARRICIVGAAGSGKTTVARLLANRLSAPWYELDAVGYEGGSGAKRSLGMRLADVQQIAAQPAWVTEGVFIWWTRELFERADLVVWLDLPWTLTMPRVVTRHIRADLAGNNRHAGYMKLLRFLWYCRTYYTENEVTVPEAEDQDWGINQITVAAWLAPYTGKLLHCRTAQDVAQAILAVQPPLGQSHIVGARGGGKKASQ
jgi:adenylate kinase family enzyme